jgi:ABC-type lipoprotein release transport system permease subunit
LYPIFLALRYARSRAVTYLALLTVAVSVASFVVVMGVLGGFRHKVEKIIQETGAPLEIYCGATYGIWRADHWANRVATVKGVRGTSPYIQTMTLIRTEGFRTLGVVKGIDLDRELRYGRLGEYLHANLPVKHVGKLKAVPPPRNAAPGPPPTDFDVPKRLRKREVDKKTLQPWEDPSRKGHKGTVPVWFRKKKSGGRSPDGEEDAEDDDEGLLPRPTPGGKPVVKAKPLKLGVIVGAKRARHLGLRPGDEMIMAVQDPDNDKLARVRSFWVIGFYKSDTDWLNEIILIDRRAAEDLTGEQQATGISIWLHDARQMYSIQQAVREVYREDAHTKVRTWRESQPQIFGMMDMHAQVMMIILLIFFVMTGAFIMAILWVLVTEKTRDIGTVRALGAGRMGVVITFVSQGLAISLLGVALGMGLGYLMSAYVNSIVQAVDGLMLKAGLGEVFGSISRELFDMEKLPVHHNWKHQGVMAGITVAVSFMASLLPALRAAILDPVEALRHE